MRVTYSTNLKAWFCAGIAGSNPAEGIGVCILWVLVCCQVKFSASDRSLVQRIPTRCDVSECDRKSSIMKRPWPNGGCCPIVKKYADNCNYSLYFVYIVSECKKSVWYVYNTFIMFHTHNMFMYTIVPALWI
jgi:hypothetical protein